MNAFADHRFQSTTATKDREQHRLFHIITEVWFDVHQHGDQGRLVGVAAAQAQRREFDLQREGRLQHIGILVALLRIARLVLRDHAIRQLQLLLGGLQALFDDFRRCVVLRGIARLDQQPHGRLSCEQSLHQLTAHGRVEHHTHVCLVHRRRPDRLLRCLAELRRIIQFELSDCRRLLDFHIGMRIGLQGLRRTHPIRTRLPALQGIAKHRHLTGHGGHAQGENEAKNFGIKMGAEKWHEFFCLNLSACKTNAVLVAGPNRLSCAKLW